MSSDLSENADSTESPTLKLPLFRLGQIVATPGVLKLLKQYSVSAWPYIERHVSGDWGNAPPEDARENELSVQKGFRVLSAYDIAGQRIWIITESDRSATTLLLPSEY